MSQKVYGGKNESKIDLNFRQNVYQEADNSEEYDEDETHIVDKNEEFISED